MISNLWGGDSGGFLIFFLIISGVGGGGGDTTPVLLNGVLSPKRLAEGIGQHAMYARIKVSIFSETHTNV